MLAQPQSSRSLVYLTVYPEGYDPERNYPLIFVLHGYGAHMYDLADFTPTISQRNYLFVLPNAPIPVLIGQGMIGYSWRPARDDGSPPEAQQAQAERVQAQVWDFFAEVMERYRVPPGRVLLAGFSQGGSLSYTMGLQRPDLFAGVAALSTGVVEPERLRSLLPADRSQPVFIAHGLQDNPDRARRSRDFLQAEGYTPEYHEYDMGHQVTGEVLADLAPWVHTVLPPIA